MITLELPYPVSANRYWRSFPHKATGRTITIVSDEAKAYKREVGWIAREAGIKTPLLGKVRLEYVLHPKRPQDWEKRQRKDPSGWDETVQCMDLLNANKVLCDALIGIVYPDDKWIWKATAERGEPREKPGVVVRISIIETGLFAQKVAA